MYFVSQLSGLCNNVLCFSAFWTQQLCTLFLSFLDSATMYFVSQFWTMQLCTLFPSFLDSATMYFVPSFLDSATMYFVSHPSGLCDNVLCLSAFWTLRRWCERRQWTWWASSFCTSRSSSTNTTICSYPGSWLVTSIVLSIILLGNGHKT
jgi:hypothetical protein